MSEPKNMTSGLSQLADDNVDLPDSSEYRSLSGLAVGSLVLGLLSSLALIHIVLWIIPVIALILAGFALRHARRTETGGEWAARAAIFLALIFGVWGVSQLVLSDWILKAKAHKLGDAWMKLVEKGQLKLAHQWTLTPSSRVQDLSLLDLYYEGQNEGSKSFNKFLEKGEMATLAKLPEGTKITFRSFDEWLKDGNQHLARLRYRVSSPGQEREVVLVVMREREAESRSIRWRVMAVEAPGESSAAL